MEVCMNNGSIALEKAREVLSEEHKKLDASAAATGHVGSIDSIMDATNAVKEAEAAVDPAGTADRIAVAETNLFNTSVHASVEASHAAAKRKPGYIQGQTVPNGLLPDYSKRN